MLTLVYFGLAFLTGYHEYQFLEET